MASNLKFVIFSLCVFSVICYSSGKSQKDKDFSSLKLSISWSPTVCRNFLNANAQTTCSSCQSTRAINQWTIHGLWPSQIGKMGPSECTDVPFDITKLSNNLRNQMRRKWPSLAMKSDVSFWTHEWIKHGTCATNLNGISEYFEKTVELYDQYDLGNMLSNAKIIPGGSYKLKNIQKALKVSLGVNAQVACKFAKGNKQFISEIKLCFDKSFQMIDCGADKSSLTNCEKQKPVIYIKRC